MAGLEYTGTGEYPQLPEQFQDFEDILAQMDDTALLQRLEAYRLVGRKGHPLRAMWRAYVVSFLLNLPTTNALIRELHNRPDLRIFCGFRTLPHRTTFNRFINRLSHHANLVEAVLVGLTDNVKALLPDLGDEVAIDSTVVEAYANPNRKHVRDPDPTWAPKNSARSHNKDGKDWNFGFKLNMVADANHGFPLAHYVTTAKRNDSPTLPTIIELAESWYPWFKPRGAMADRGYDATTNYEYLNNKGILPIIPMRKASNTKNGWHEGVYTPQGVPTCIGQVPMKFVRSDPQKGYLYRCKGCHLINSRRGGIRHCDTEVWEDPTRNLRLFGPIRKGSKKWKVMYGKRQAVERLFKSLKESRRLKHNCLMGLRLFRLHAAMSVMTYQATVLVNLQAGREPRWMVKKVA